MIGIPAGLGDNSEINRSVWHRPVLGRCHFQYGIFDTGALLLRKM